MWLILALMAWGAGFRVNLSEHDSGILYEKVIFA